jgi:hypothetical protein
MPARLGGGGVLRLTLERVGETRPRLVPKDVEWPVVGLMDDRVAPNPNGKDVESGRLGKVGVVSVEGASGGFGSIVRGAS